MTARARLHVPGPTKGRTWCGRGVWQVNMAPHNFSWDDPKCCELCHGACERDHINQERKARQALGLE